MTTTAAEQATTQVHTTYVQASAEAVWAAITRPEWTIRYGYAAPVEYELRPGGAYRATATEEMQAQGAPGLMIEGEVLEVDPCRRLVQTWNPLFGPPITDEPATRLTWELEPQGAAGTKLTLVHELEDAPATAAVVDGAVPEMGGGWAWVLSDLKTLLERDAGAGRQLAVNVAVADLRRAVDFYGRLGFAFDERFADETATCMVVGGGAYVMLLERERFARFTPLEVADPTRATEAILAFGVESREEVDRLAEEALAAGGSPEGEPQDHDVMYERSFRDPDGHLCTVFWMRAGGA